MSGPLIALEFLTLLRLRRVAQHDDRAFSTALGWFPLVGLLLGAALLAIDVLLRDLLPRGPLAAIEIALLAILTGGLHLDGVADTADGMAVQGDRAERLGVMSEGSTGPAGAMALAMVVIAGWAGLSALPDSSRAAALLLGPCLGRWAVVPVAVLFQPARPRGIGFAMQQQIWPLAAPLATVIAVAAAALLFGPAGIVVLLIAGAAAVVMAGAAARLLHGVTGDVFGAAVELSQVAAWYAIIAGAGQDWLEATL